jgi:DnaJ like chaperone protein
MSNEAGGIGGMLRDFGNALGGLFGGGNLSPERQVSLEVLFGLLGYLAKLDSLITSHEADFINGLMDQLKLNMREREVASDALQRGRNREIVLQDEFKRFRKVNLAAADERLRPKERQFLETATVELGFDIADLDQRLARFREQG